MKSARNDLWLNEPITLEMWKFTMFYVQSSFKKVVCEKNFEFYVQSEMKILKDF